MFYAILHIYVTICKC